MGIASLTDRTLPHLFPRVDKDVFNATLDRSVGIERPPPRSSLVTTATKLDALATIRGQRYFTPKSRKRVVVVLTDGESQPVSAARLSDVFRQAPAIETVFVQFWDRGRAGLRGRRARARLSARPVRPSLPRASRSGRRRKRLRRRRARSRLARTFDADSAPGRPSSAVSRAGESPSRHTSPRRRWRRSSSSSGAAIARPQAPRRETTVRPPPGIRSRPCRRSRGSASQTMAPVPTPARASRTASSPCPGPPCRPALARRSRQRVSAARSTSLPCSSYHPTPTERSTSGPASIA